MDEIIENIPQEPSKCKKILDFVVRILWSIVWLSFVRFVSFILCTKYLDISDFWKVLVISLGVVVLFMILAHFIIKLPKTSKLKKRIKWVLIVVYCIIVTLFLWFILKPYWMEKNCKCMCSSSSGQKVCDCLEYVCYEKGMRNRLQKCKNRCKIKIRKSHNSCISECEQEFQKNRVWIN